MLKISKLSFPGLGIDSFDVNSVCFSLFGYEIATTLTLLSVVINELVFAYNCKELKEFSHKKGLFGNKVLNISVLIILLIQIPVFFTPIGSIFGLAQITAMHFISVIGANIIFFIVMEFVKIFCAKTFKDK